MAEITCRSCHCAPPAAEGLCIVCLRDKLAADKERRLLAERRQRHARRREPGKIGAGWDRALQQRRD